MAELNTWRCVLILLVATAVGYVAGTWRQWYRDQHVQMQRRMIRLRGW